LGRQEPGANIERDVLDFPGSRAFIVERLKRGLRVIDAHADQLHGAGQLPYGLRIVVPETAEIMAH
jgi:hypothetical protein